MKVEKIKILARELGLEGSIDRLIYLCKHTTGDFSFTKKGAEKDKLEYQPKYDALHNEVSLRLEKVLSPEFTGWKWSFGRLSDGTCYISLYNPEWEK